MEENMKKIILLFGFLILISSVSQLIAQTEYWKENFEDSRFPGSPGPNTATEITDTNGVWILYACYRTSSSSGTPVGTYDLRMPKPASVSSGGFCFIVTPKLTEGVSKISFYEGRGSRVITVEKSTDDGKTWVFVDTIRTTAKAQNACKINDLKVNRVRLSNQFTSDADIDEYSVYKFDPSSDVKNTLLSPVAFNLEQNYPNPFNPSTVISYSLPKNSFVSLKIYDIQGKEIKTLVNEYKTAGNYVTEWKPENMPSGIYMCILNTGNISLTKKMLLTK
jgi:hypothetical protein